jgi:hypothetical protein
MAEVQARAGTDFDDSAGEADEELVAVRSGALGLELGRHALVQAGKDGVMNRCRRAIGHGCSSVGSAEDGNWGHETEPAHSVRLKRTADPCARGGQTLVAVTSQAAPSSD